MRCGGQRACNPASSQRQFEYRFSVNAALADATGEFTSGREPEARKPMRCGSYLGEERRRSNNDIVDPTDSMALIRS